MIISNGAIPAAMSSASGSALVAGVPPDPGPGGTAPVRPFRLDQVRLGGGLLQEKRDRIKAYLQHYD